MTLILWYEFKMYYTLGKNIIRVKNERNSPISTWNQSRTQVIYMATESSSSEPTKTEQSLLNNNEGCYT